jgi:hypothetical protein
LSWLVEEELFDDPAEGKVNTAKEEAHGRGNDRNDDREIACFAERGPGNLAEFGDDVDGEPRPQAPQEGQGISSPLGSGPRDAGRDGCGCRARKVIAHPARKFARGSGAPSAGRSGAASRLSCHRTYRVSRWALCARQRGQNLLSSIRSVSLRRFFWVV